VVAAKTRMGTVIKLSRRLPFHVGLSAISHTSQLATATKRTRYP
jgi:hypothetical protein